MEKEEIENSCREGKSDIGTNEMAFVFKKLVPFYIIIILVFIAGFRPIGFDRDSFNYAQTIQEFNFDDFSKLDIRVKEPMFYLIIYINQWLHFDAIRGTLIIFALLGVTLKIMGIYKLSPIPFLSVIFYVCYYFPLHELTQIRVGVASAIFLHSISDIANNKPRAYLIKAFFAILFHYSALIMLPLYPILRFKKLNDLFYFVLPILGYFFYLERELILNFLIINKSIFENIPSFISHKLLFYIELTQADPFAGTNLINIFNLYNLSLVGLYYFLISNINRFKSDVDALLIKILGFALFSFAAFSFVPVIAVRISEFLGIVIIILLAYTVKIFKQKVFVYLVVLIYSTIALVNLIFIQRLFEF